MWRRSMDDLLPFETSYMPPDDESPSAFDGDYVHGDVTSRIEGIGGGVRFRRIRDGVADIEDIATRVGPEAFMSRSSGKIMQFPSSGGKWERAYLAEGNVWKLLGE